MGDRILVSGETRTVVSITDDTHLTVDTAFSNNPNDTSPKVNHTILNSRDSSDSVKAYINNIGQVVIGAGGAPSGSNTTTQLTVYDATAKGTVDLLGTTGGDFRIAQGPLIANGYISLTYTSPKLGLTRTGTHFLWYDTSTGDVVFNNTSDLS